jgi:uncharacterized protein (DUF2236 family)
VPYSAGTPELAAWVHNSLTDSFLVANQMFGRHRLTGAEADRFVHEQTRVGALLGAQPLPDTAHALETYVAEHPSLAPSPGANETMAFLRNPPLPAAIRAGYRILASAAAATIPERLRQVLDLTPPPLARQQGALAVAALRWALGASPRWRIALLRVGADIPEGQFKQKLPFEDLPRREA